MAVPGTGKRLLVVVADTTPLLYLSRLGQLQLLCDLYAAIVVPGAVWAELVEARPEAPGVSELSAATWIEVDTSSDVSAVARELALTLDAGEAAAIALAITRHADLLLIDEHAGRRVASAHGLRIRGTVGVLVSARLQGLLPALRPVLDALLSAGFRLDQALYLDALASVGEESG